MYTPQRLFGELGSSSDVLSHEPFLERARLQREQERDGAARLALGAYVVARLINRLLSLETGVVDALDGFRWQLEAVRRHIADLPADVAETAHLSGIAAVVSSDGLIGPELWKALTAYAYYLEHEGQLEEGLEILNLAVRAQGLDTPAQDFAVYALFAARLNRQLARWDSATTCYAAGEEAARACGDEVSALRGRLGQGAVQRGRGNLPLAREIAEVVVRDSAALCLQDVQALAYADLGVVLGLQGHRLEALQAHYEAFRLTNDPQQRVRTLGDLALGLHEIGAYDAARIAFQIVADSSVSLLVRANARLELMDLESSSGNRIAFEHCRGSVEAYYSRMSPSMLVDYHYKLGLGLARFGQTGRASDSLQAGLLLAEKHHLNAWYFKIEEALSNLHTHTQQETAVPPYAELSTAPAVRQMETGLREYALSISG